MKNLKYSFRYMGNQVSATELEETLLHHKGTISQKIEFRNLTSVKNALQNLPF
jgi:hypothetical protein